MHPRLRYNVLFEELDDDLFADLRPHLREQRFEAGQIIIENESDGDELYLIADGRVRIVKPVRDGDAHTLALLHPGDFFGELELVDARPRSARAVAEDPCILYVLRKEAFDMLLERSHPFTTRLLQVLSLRLRALTNHFLRELRTGHDRMTAELHHLEQLIEAAKNVNSTLDLDRVLSIVVDTAISIVGCASGTLYLVDEPKREIWSTVLRESRLEEVRLPIGKGIAGYVAATGDILNIADAYLDPRFNPEYDRLSGFRTTTLLCMALRNPSGTIIGVLQLLNKRSGLFTRNDESFIDALSVHAAIAIENARLHEQERTLNRMRDEIRLAAKIQLDLLPASAPVIPGYDIAGRSIPARSVGGDYFDFIRVDVDRLAVAIGDVSGKGLPASLLMANVQATLRGQTMFGSTPGLCLQRANTLLYRSTSEDKFVTLFFLLLDHGNHALSFANAGHDNPFYRSRTDPPSRLASGGPPLSILEEFPYEGEERPMAPGDLIVMTTDGITEAMTTYGEQYGEQRLEQVIAVHRDATASALIDYILEDVRRHVGAAPQMDDMTLVVVRRTEE